MSEKTKSNFNPQVWTLVRDGKPIKTCLVCAKRVYFIGKLKTADKSEQFEEIIHLVAIDLSYFETGLLNVCTFKSKNGTWDIDTRLEKFNLTHRTASAALEMAYRFDNPKTKENRRDLSINFCFSSSFNKAVATKQNASTIWKMKAFLCHVIWDNLKLTTAQRIESLKRQGHTGITEKALEKAMENMGI